MMSKIYVVCGELLIDEEEANYWLVIAYLNKDSANAHANIAYERAIEFSSEIESLPKKYRAGLKPIFYPNHYVIEEYYGKYGEEKSFNKYDPKMKFLVRYDKVFIPDYYVKECELFCDESNNFNEKYISLLRG